MDKFKSKLGFIFAGLGMAVGAGNIWRFPRVAAQNGGGAFIFTWALFLFLWSLPLLIIEFSIGRKTKMGLIGSFRELVGEKYTWMGGFIGFVSTAIMFYYSVVTGWFLRYFIKFLTYTEKNINTQNLWNNFVGFKGGFFDSPVFYQFIAIAITGFVVYFGISKGIEKANSFLIPSLFILLIFAMINVFFLPGFSKGMEFLFNFDLKDLLDHKVWVNGLTQSAWSTGAGWGLILTYSIYTTKKEDPVISSTVISLGNNSASLIAAIIIVPTIFSFNSVDASLKIMSSSNQGFAFIHLPFVFLKMPFGNILIVIFFLALFFAAFSSLISLLELPVRILMDFGLTRKRAILFVTMIGFLFGLPSALDIRVFNNQDWVWGLGLMVSGFFFVIGLRKYGIDRFRVEIINKNSHIKLNKTFNFIVKYLIPLEFLFMIVWWFYQSFMWEGKNAFSIFSQYSPVSTIFQWGIILIALLLFNKKIIRILKK